MKFSRIAGTAIAWIFSAALAGSLRAQDLKDLPLTEVPGPPSDGRVLGLLLSGDGGWASIDKDIAQALASQGVAVVGLNSRSYLGTRRSPERVAADVDRILRHYLAAWNRERVVLIGYSRGAVILPFIANRLPEDLRARIDLIAMLGLGFHAGFHVSLFDLLSTTTSDKDPPVAPEIEALAKAKIRMLCVYGTDEKESFCRDGPEGWMVKIAKKGAHHFDGDHGALAADILAQLGRE